MGEISFNPRSKSLIIPLKIESYDGRAALTVRAVLDTGATMTIVSWDTAMALGYDPARSPERRRIITGSSIEYAPAITIQKITAIGESLINTEALCHDLPVESGIEALVGLNFLRLFDLCIEFSRSIITLKKKSQAS